METPAPEAVKKPEEVAAPHTQNAYLEFPEAKIKGDGFTQMNPNTGWFWLGINIKKFSFRQTWAFIKSQEFSLVQAYEPIEREQMVKAQLAMGVKPAKGFRGFLGQ